MGDRSTHVIQWAGYWYLVYSNDEVWIDSKTQETICHVGREERLISLEDGQ